MHPDQAIIQTKDGSNVTIKFDEMQFTAGHSFVEGTSFHKTNALFQTSSTEVYKRTGTIERDGCRV